ncbi:G-PROTEIN-RECEP-F1-2 domain-containing protein [Aphelenchoides besseyi]|nr:G-PROTEIN-RECEP-F1-2 domain-containing protein [Aphelenchoides besseyi]
MADVVDSLVIADDGEHPPKHLVNDFIEMFYLSVVILLGVPLNIHVLYRLLGEMKRTPKNSVKGSFLLLKINLNISDLLILLIQALGKLCWIATYDWKGGEFLCRVFNFLSMFTLYLSSNMVCCIALDRLRTVLSASKIRQNKSQSNITRRLILTAWFLAAVWSCPQLYVWRMYEPYGDEWYQCSDIWSIHEHQNSVRNKTDLMLGFIYNQRAKDIYNIVHLILVFYGPLVMLFVCYSFIAARLTHYSVADPCLSSQRNGLCTREPTIDTCRLTLNDGDDSNRLRSKSMELRNDQPIRPLRHSTVSAYARSEERHLTESETPTNVTIALVPEEEPPRKRTVIGTMIEWKKEFTYCAFGNDLPNKLNNEPTTTRDAESLTRSLTPVPPLSLPTANSALSLGESEQPPSRSHSAVSLAFRRIRRQKRTISEAPGASRLPVWRRQLRSRVFRTTLLIIITHILLWLPYNLYALTKYISNDLHQQLNEQGNIFKELQFLIACINPFLYGFSQSA